MAKGNLFLGTASGSVGDVTMSRRNGSQISRVRVRKVGNPRTAAQAHNRALLSTLGVAYGYMRGIVDHSFQGLSKKSMNMQKFMADNQGLARQLDGAPAFDLQAYNYNFKGETVLRPNPYIIARGTLPSVDIKMDVNSSDVWTFRMSAWDALMANYATATYQDLANALGVEPGTQITFCVISDDTFSGVPDTSGDMPKSYGNFHFARAVLMPANELPGTLAFTAAGDGFVTFNMPNAKNQGNIKFDISDTTKCVPVVANHRYPLAIGIIASNWNGGTWLRSYAEMLVAYGYEYSNGMAEVYGSYMDAADEQPVSTQYLNQSADYEQPGGGGVTGPQRLISVTNGVGRDIPLGINGKYQVGDGVPFHVVVQGPHLSASDVVCVPSLNCNANQIANDVTSYIFAATNDSDYDITIGSVHVIIDGKSGSED